jgi:hypothetical protein
MPLLAPLDPWINVYYPNLQTQMEFKMANTRTSAAHVFYDDIFSNSDPLAKIRALYDPAAPTFEGDHLDFKTTLDRDKGTQLSDDKIKDMWSEALGGFANMGGGVILWGIDCRKVNGIDAANKEILVPNVLAFQSKLKEWARSANDPPIPNVEMEPVSASGDDGFLVCLIPQSQHLPHSSAFIKNKSFVVRIGDTFRNASPPLLRRLFYPQLVPDFRFSGIGKIVLNAQQSFTISFELFIENLGTGTAKDVCVIVRDVSNDPARSSDIGTQDQSWELANPPTGRGHCFYGRRCLHPGMKSRINWFRWSRTPDGNITTRGQKVVEGKFPPLVLDIQTYAENIAAQSCALTVNDDQFITSAPVQSQPLS